MTKTCWLTMDDDSKFDSSTSSNTVAGSLAANSSNPMTSFGTVNQISIYLCRSSTLSGGTFRFGVWDFDASQIRVTDTFSGSTIATGSSYSDCVEVQHELTSSLSSINVEDVVGIECVTAPSGSGEIFIGTENPAASEWKRVIFTAGSGSTGTQASRGIKVCLDSAAAPPPPSTGGVAMPPPIAWVNI